MMMPEVVYDDTPVREAVKKLEEELKPDVVRIGYTIRRDWVDEWGIYFRVLLADKAATKKRLRPTAKKFERRLDELLDYRRLGVNFYPRYRTVSEQKKVKDKEWAA